MWLLGLWGWGDMDLILRTFSVSNVLSCWLMIRKLNFDQGFLHLCSSAGGHFTLAAFLRLFQDIWTLLFVGGLLEGWRWGMVKLKRWVAKLGRRSLSQGDGWLSWYRYPVARLLATAALWVRIQTSMKNTKMGNISKGVANILWPAKKYTKNIFFAFWTIACTQWCYLYWLCNWNNNLGPLLVPWSHKKYNAEAMTLLNSLLSNGS